MFITVVNVFILIYENKTLNKLDKIAVYLLNKNFTILGAMLKI